MSFNHELLRQALILKRRRSGLSLVQAQVASGVTDSTISRYERGIGEPDAETVGRLAEWVGVPLWQVTGEPEPVKVEGDALANIEELLRSDPKLSDRDADSLMSILRTAYERAVEK